MLANQNYHNQQLLWKQLSIREVLITKIGQFLRSMCKSCQIYPEGAQPTLLARKSDLLDLTQAQNSHSNEAVHLGTSLEQQEVLAKIISSFFIAKRQNIREKTNYTAVNTTSPLSLHKSKKHPQEQGGLPDITFTYANFI
jgi:hypothetical protein